MAVVDEAPVLSLEDVHRAHYRSLVRLASLLLGDASVAEEVVQDAFVSTFRAGDHVRDPLLYVRRAVVNGARSAGRRRAVRERAPSSAAPEAAPGRYPSDHDDVIAALRSLPRRQRECLVLRYYLDLSEAEIAHALGVSVGSVKTHAHRGLHALESMLEVDR